MTLPKPLSCIALATALAAPASAQCDCGDPMEFTTITESYEFQDDLGSAPFPRQPMAMLPQFDIDAAAAENMTGTENVNLVCAEVQFGAIIVPTGTLTNGSSSPCTAAWNYDVQVALYANMEVAVPGAYFPSSNSGEEMLDGGSSAPLSMPPSASTSSYTETVDFTNWIGTGELVWEGDGLAFEIVSGCDPITADFMNNVTISYSVTYTYCIPGEPPPPTGPGTPYCFGDGSGTACPCMNESAVDSGQGCLNGQGMGGLINGTGTNSLMADDLVITATNLIPGNPGLLFSGMNATNGGDGQVGFDGLRCAGGGLIRHGTGAPDMDGTIVFGPMLENTDQYSPGETRRFQVWYRSPGANSPCGADANFTNGYEVTFTP